MNKNGDKSNNRSMLIIPKLGITVSSTTEGWLYLDTLYDAVGARL